MNILLLKKNEMVIPINEYANLLEQITELKEFRIKANFYGEKEKPMSVQKTREITYIPKSNKVGVLKCECPKCKKAFHIVFDDDYKYCPYCGQALEVENE